MSAGRLFYVVGIEIDAWLGKGCAVVVNGSRSYVPAARRRYPGILVVWISAQPEVLASRLAQRGRESLPQIDERLRRNASLGVNPPAGTLHIANDGLLEEAGGRLVALLKREDV